VSLHCTMTFYGDERDGPDLPKTWYHYLVVASPGARAGSGVASILTLSEARADGMTHGPSHTIISSEGGPEAALDMAEQFLTRHHPGLNKIISRRQD
jgi:hypothetical protein